jgi:hypothetical protein
MRSLGASLTLSIASACMLAGCASTESGIKPESMSEFTLGATTRQYVIRTLGTPSSTTTLPDGSTFLVYAFTGRQPFWNRVMSNFGPYATTNVQRTTISFLFGPDDILKKSDTVSYQ